MPSFTNTKPLTPSAPNDISIAECYSKIDTFLDKNDKVSSFKIEDDNHGMGMISTLDSNVPKQAINIRLDESTIRNYMVNNGFQFDSTANPSICKRQ